MKKFLSTLLVAVLVITMSSFVFATEGTDTPAGNGSTSGSSTEGTTTPAPDNGTAAGATTGATTGATAGATTGTTEGTAAGSTEGAAIQDGKVTYDATQAVKEDVKNNGKGAGKVKTNNSNSEKKVSQSADQASIELLNKLKELEKASLELEAKYKEALKQNGTQSTKLKEQLRVMKEEIKTRKAELNDTRKQLREMVRATYTEKEMEQIAETENELKKKYPNDKILPVDSIVPHGFSFKFDTPPVIREGRTLVPVRALTEGLGATVTWTAQTKTVIIEKDGTKIELQLANQKAFVNGKEVILEVPPTSLNNRTVVPLRFIAEQFGYKIEFVKETETIELVTPQPDAPVVQ